MELELDLEDMALVGLEQGVLDPVELVPAQAVLDLVLE